MSNLGNRKVMSENIDYYMRKNRKTRKEICEALGIKYTTFTDWVNGNTYPRIDKIELMADYFGIEKSDLIEDKNIKSIDNISSSLLSKFNQLTPANQTTVMGMIDLLLSQQSSESKKTATCV